MAVEDILQLGHETCGIDIMDVREIVALQEIRTIPTAPPHVAGILDLRGVFVPIIDLHRRFHLERPAMDEVYELVGGFVIIEVWGTGIRIRIGRVVRVVKVALDSVQQQPQMLSGIGTDYIRGVSSADDGRYLIILDVGRLFNPRELGEIDNLR